MEYLVRRLDAEHAARGYAAVTRATLAELGLSNGDPVAVVAGERRAVRRVHHGDFEDRGLPVVGVDSYTCDRLGVDPGDRVGVEPTTVPVADGIRVALPRSVNLHGDDAALLGRRLRGRVVEAGVPAAVAVAVDADAGGVEGRFPVRPTAVDPDGPARVGPDTAVAVDQESALWRPADVDADADGAVATTADVGGLAAELRELRELVGLPLSHPELFDRLGVDPPSGVLLYGPPGAGKTLLAAATAGDLDPDVDFLEVAAAELLEAGRGLAEAALCDLAAEARDRAPAVVLVDGLETVAGGDDRRGDGRTAAEFGRLLDDLADADGVSVVGATSRLDAVDDRLRRPGRFDREVEVGVPDAAGREAILSIHAEGVPLAPAVDLGDYAVRTPGFVGADLVALVREAALAAVDRVESAGTVDLDADAPLDEDALADVTVTVADVDRALTRVEPTATRGVAVEEPAVGWDDVGGLDDVKARLREAVQWPLDHGAAFRELDVEPASGILLYGPPGTGKTLLAKAVASEADCSFLPVDGPELLDMWVGESERNVREVFERARRAAPSVICFDELDALATSRGTDAGTDVGDRVVSQLLTELDGVDPLEDVVVVATTNRRELLDDALCRPGRLDYELAVPNPDAAARREILAIHTREKPVADDVDVDRLVEATAGRSGAEVAAVAREAAMAALREALASGVDPADAVIDAAHLDVGLAHLDGDGGRAGGGRRMYY
jgi:transitional endoplasmic reticulum ATPase